MSDWDIQLIKSEQEILNLQPEWKEFLEESTGESTFRQDPEIINYRIKHHNIGKPFIIVLRQHGDIECIAPCVIKQTPLLLTFSVFKIPCFTTRILSIIDDSFIFSKKAETKECTRKVINILSDHKNLFDIIKLEVLETTNPLYSFYQTSIKHNCFNLKTTSPKKEHVWRHILAETYDAWLKTLGNSTRRLTKRRVKNLYDKYPDQIDFTKITASSEVPELLNYIDELYPKTWQAKTFGNSKRNSQKNVEFYEKIASLGFLRSYILLINKQPVAFFIATQYANTFEAQEIGYDTKYSSIGIGSALNYMVIKNLYDHNKPEILSFGFGDNKYKEILCNSKNPAYEAYLTQRNRAGLIIKLQTVLNAIEYRVRHVLIKYKLDDRIRKILKKK